jgi:predicted RNase H-like HicB family nuclease
VPSRTFKAVFEPDGAGWVVSIPALQGCHSQGRSLSEARTRIRDALSLHEEQLDGKVRQVARDAVLEEDVRLPAELRAAIRRVHRARERAAVAASEVREAQSAAARALSETRSLRDAGELLGLSHQAIKKILAASSPGSGKKKTRQR